MSKIKKKINKQPMRLRTLVASLMLIAPVTHSADTAFSSRPLVGAGDGSFAPHVALALSVEFPTAGAAYSGSTMLSVNDAADSSPLTQTYLGYFDNTKCYRYRHNSNGYFYPTSQAETDENGNHGLCNAGGETEEFSGNMLNFMTMTAVDIFRSAMTGGNRALGASIDAKAYTDGDTETETFLRRAKVQFNQNGASHYKMSDRQLDVFNVRGEKLALLKRLLPHYFIDVMAKDLVAGETVTGDPNNTNQAYGKPAQLHFRSLNFGNQATFSLPMAQSADGSVYTPEQTVTQGLWQAAGEFDRFSDNNLHFFNNGFNLHIVRKVSKGMRRQFIHRPTGRAVGNPTYASNPQTDLGLKGHEYWAVVNSDTVDPQYRDNARRWQKALNVVVKVCDPAVGLEENCKPYGNNYKPEGLLQEYTKSNGMRFATFGYLNIAGNDIDGGVLRSRMKSLIGDKKQEGETYSTVYGDEWDSTTGILYPNPDTTDAQQSNVSNSGTINYLNKFGDKSGYKTNDPAGELYETALAYLRGTSVGNGIYKPADNLLTDDAKDGFPAIYNWDDPYKRGVNADAQHCHQNSIILIGDTNTHADDSVINANSKVSSYLERLFNNEFGQGHGIDTTTNFGSRSSPAYMAGLAYWAHTNNIRPDLKHTKDRPINSTNFIIDVVENGDDKANPMRNAYYLAAKYGGFNLKEKNKKFDLTQNADNNKPLPIERESWTDDASGESSIAAFRGGVPRNFAIANNPQAMKDALGKAIASGAALGHATQTATGLSVVSGEVVDFTDNKEDVLLQSTYDFAKLSGDMIAQVATYEPDPKTNQILKLTDKWRASTQLTPNRPLFTIRNNTVYRFNEQNSAEIFAGIPMRKGSAEQLVNYVLGSRDDEGIIYRKRDEKSLMGTIVNSTVMPIVTLEKKHMPLGCSYPSDLDVEARPIHYAAAANDGILHIVNGAGEPVTGYMASTALAKLPDYADNSYTHQYLNDGTPVIKELCMGVTTQTNREAKTVLLGTTGRGGNAVYALDVTYVPSFTEKNVLWEFSDTDLGLTVSKPVVTLAPDGRPLAIVSSGYNNISGSGHIYILDISKSKGSPWIEGSNFWKIRLGNSGVGAPFVYEDSDGAGLKIFVGDLEGKLWQIDRKSDSGTGNWTVAYTDGTGQKVPLFTPNASSSKPITAAPYADTVSGRLMVAVGTGKYFAEDDLNTKQKNYAYGLFVGDSPVKEEDLLTRQIIETPLTGENINNRNNTRRFYGISEGTMTEQHKGWRLALLDGQNIAADATIREKQAAEFVAVQMMDGVDVQCNRSGATSYISVDARNGGMNRRPMFDTNGDGKVDANDAQAGMTSNIGVVTPLMTLIKAKTNDGTKPLALTRDGRQDRETLLGNFGAVKGVRRISWREIF